MRGHINPQGNLLIRHPPSIPFLCVLTKTVVPRLHQCAESQVECQGEREVNKRLQPPRPVLEIFHCEEGSSLKVLMGTIGSAVY